MRIATVLAIVSLLCLPTLAQEQAGQPLKVRKVVVYKHGVGYFEREGKVVDDKQITLTFKSAQMKDLLKSLYAVDLSGGQIATISYDTRDPLSKQLEDILIHVPEGNALTQFLTQLKGAKIDVVIGGDTVSGRVLGIEPITRQTQTGTVTAYKLVLFRDDGKIQPVDLLEVTSLTLQDEGLRNDLQRVLEIFLKAKHADRKSVVLNATGRGERDIRVGYIIETPIWKTSYRLLFDEGKQPLLQGWAILENTTDEDWDQVDVSFVAGSPMSFIMDLYTAYYPRRWEIPVGVATAAAPTEDSEGGGRAFAQGRGRRQLDAARKARGYAKEEEKSANEPMPEAPMAATPKRSFAEELEESVAPAAAGVDIGELFAYQAREKVSVRRGQAALVPILSERVDGGERILYYRPSVSSRPMNAYYFKNATSLTLEAGPVTFFDGSTCVGEGLMRKVLKKDMRDMIPYAVEAGVTVEARAEHRSDPVTRGYVANGILVLQYVQNLESVYAIHNQLQRDTVMYLDHVKSGGYALATPTKAEEEIDGHYRFKIELKAGAKVEWKIRETQPVSTQVSLLGTPAETIRFYLAQRYLSDAAKKFLGELLEMQGEINRLRQDEADLNRERASLSEDQARIRQNLSVLRETAGELEKRRKYLNRLEETDTRLDKIREELREKSERRQQKEQELSSKVQEFKEE